MRSLLTSWRLWWCKIVESWSETLQTRWASPMDPLIQLWKRILASAKVVLKLLTIEKNQFLLEITQNMLETTSNVGSFSLENRQAIHKMWYRKIVEICLILSKFCHIKISDDTPLHVLTHLRFAVDSVSTVGKISHLRINVTCIRSPNHVSLAIFVFARKIKVGYLLNRTRMYATTFLALLPITLNLQNFLSSD